MWLAPPLEQLMEVALPAVPDVLIETEVELSLGPELALLLALQLAKALELVLKQDKGKLSST